MSSFELLSPAKINLFLKVLRKRDDGYHDICSLMQPISLYDRVYLNVSEGEGVSALCAHPQVPSGSSNLVCKAAELFLKTVGIKKKIDITIEKAIPVGGGLGGGSSNAATVLMGLNRLLEAGLGTDALMDMASRIGSDAPFFILNSPAVAEGRGEILKRVDIPNYHYILINPGIHVSTSWVYNNLDLTKIKENNNLLFLEFGLAEADDIKKYLVNDLEEVTVRKYPVVSALKDMMAGFGALGSLMSGSGPTVFGIFPEEAARDRALLVLKKSIDKSFFIAAVEGL